MCATLTQVGLIDDLIDIVWRYVTIIWVMRCEVTGCTRFAAQHTEEDEMYLCKKHAVGVVEPFSFVRITSRAHFGDLVWVGFNQAEWLLRFWVKQSDDKHVVFAHKLLLKWGGVEERLPVVTKRKPRKPKKLDLSSRKPWR